MERIIQDIRSGLRALSENNIKTPGWEATICVPEGRKDKIIQWFREHTVVSDKLLEEGKIAIDGVIMKVSESRGLVLVDIYGDVDKQVRASSLKEGEFMII